MAQGTESGSMAEISASMVMDLRGRTGLPMMECKRALTEAAGDLGKAEELLRIRSGAKALKAADRVAAEGVIGAFIAADGKTGAMLELNCETDFVARNVDFVAFARALAQLVAEKNPADVAALSALAYAGGNVEAARQALVQKLGENVSVRRFVRVASPARLAQYVHGGRIGVTVAYEGGDDETGKDVAMHVAAGAAPGAARPIAVSRNEVAPEVIERERAIYTAQAAESGKPAEIVAKMVEGRLNKFLSEVTLLGQPFVKNPDESVEKYLKARGASVKSFEFYVVGEGIDKKKDDFAAEVAAMAKTA
jgi:elongation factor Ts